VRFSNLDLFLFFQVEDSSVFFFLGFFFPLLNDFDRLMSVSSLGNENELWPYLILENCFLGQCLLKVRVRKGLLKIQLFFDR
jgi:hypothetical protein